MLDLCEAEYMDAVESLERGHYRKAASKFKASIQRATGAGLLLYRMRSMFGYIEVLALSGDTAKADKLINSTLKESEQMFVGKEAFHALTLSSAARHHFLYTGDLEQTLTLLRSAVSILKRTSLTEIPQFAEVFFRLHDCLKELCRYEESIEVIEDAIVYCKRELGEFDASVAFAYFLLLSTLRLIEVDEEAPWFTLLVDDFLEHCRLVTTDKADLVPEFVPDNCKYRNKHFGTALKHAFSARIDIDHLEFDA